MELDFNTIYQKSEYLFNDPKTWKFPDTVAVRQGYGNCTAGNLGNDKENIYLISDVLAECKKHNIAVSEDWKIFNENFVFPRGDGQVFVLAENNPSGLINLWRTDGHSFVSYGHVTNPSFSTKYQSFSGFGQSNPYVVNYSDFNTSTFKEEILNVSLSATADIGAVALANTGKYKLCLRGPSERKADFNLWFISITNSNAVIITGDIPLIVSIMISGGNAKYIGQEYRNWNTEVSEFFKVR